jgi:uncharacterized iron-regulated protein
MTSTLPRRLLLLLCAVAAAACSHRPLRLQDHVLVGRIWDVRAQREIEPGELTARLRAAPVVLLGEMHDNTAHHRVQEEVFASLSQPRPRALAMEQFDREHQAQIDAALREGGADAERIADAGRFDRPGWDWPLYASLVEQALKMGAPIVAVNLSRREARRVASNGFAALGEDWAARHAVEEAWNDARQQALAESIREGHCGQVPDQVLPGIVRAQRSRDATMAAAILPHLERGVVGIVGRGHARRDIGIPAYLARLSPASAVAVVALVEVEQDATDARAYADEMAHDALLGMRYDYLWFTPRALRKDPCAGFDPARLPQPGGGAAAPPR